MNQYRQNQNIIMRSIGDEKVLIPLNQTGVEIQKIYTLNNTAASVWTLLATPKTFDQLVEELENNFSGPHNIIKAEVKKLVRDLQKINFVDIYGE
ncbi:MAG: PqqD family protein [Desulfobacteraceae bacterium]|nr:PqqD family protein [Desulfobacteraceae bacterium]